jgi:hypothetical protein
VKKLSVVLFLLVLCGCAGNGPGGLGASCATGQLLGSDNQCYSCNYGTPEYANNRFGSCSSLSAGGVACCWGSGSYGGSITCPQSGLPYLCSNLLCYGGPQNGLTCIYDP